MLGDVVKRAASFGPAYLRLLWTILSHPVSEVSLRASRGGFAADACALWAISMLFYFTVRFIAWNAGVDDTLFFVGRMLSEGAILAGVTLGFYWGGCVVRGRAGPGMVLTATAYIWGAMMPLQAVSALVMFGLLESVDRFAYVTVVNIANGCQWVGSLLDTRQAIEDSAQADPARFMVVLGLIAVQYIVLTAIYVVYGVAFFRVLRRLHDVSTLRFTLAAVLGSLIALVLAGYGEVFAYYLWRPNAPCLPVDPV